MRVLQCSLSLLMTSQVLFLGVTAFVTRGREKAESTAPEGTQGNFQTNIPRTLKNIGSKIEETLAHSDIEHEHRTEEEQSKASNEDAIADTRRDQEARLSNYFNVENSLSAKCDGELQQISDAIEATADQLADQYARRASVIKRDSALGRPPSFCVIRRKESLLGCR